MPTEESKTGEQKAAEANVEGFKKELGPFVVAAETTRMAMVFTDAKEKDNPIIFANESFLKLTGYPREEVLGQSFNFLMARGADTEALDQIQSAFAGKTENDPEIRYRRSDGSIFWASIFLNPVLDETGTITQHFASFVNLTKDRREQERLRYLLDELNHRTQNTLATVLAMAAQTLRGMADEAVIAAFEGRVLALSKVQGLLGLESWDGLGLRDVLNEILQPIGLGDDRESRFSMSGPDARLRPKTALTLGMVFHELASNAVQHGALSSDGAGRIDITWTVEAAAQADRMRLRWQESGGPTVTPPNRKGFGSRLIESGLAQELDGDVRLSYEPAGLLCEIAMPLPRGGGWVSP
jgi:PAS domain S-box-containing protein